jgi:AraC-like DNA-binding protein
VDFGGPMLALAVPNDLLTRPLRRVPAAVTDAGPAGADLAVAPGFVGSLRQAVAPLVSSRPLSIELGAELARTRPRTLRRWLAQEGTSWRQIVDRVRLDACQRLMTNPSLSLADIATELGYSDQAHLSRSFLRWKGEAPSTYRRRMAGNRLRSNQFDPSTMHRAATRSVRSQSVRA